MNVIDLLSELNRRGVELTPEVDSLHVESPDGAITEELRAALVEHKQELITILERVRLIKARIAAAFIQAEEKYPGRLDWYRDTPEVRDAEQGLDEAMSQYVEGQCSLDDVQLAWQRFIHSLEIYYTASE